MRTAPLFFLFSLLCSVLPAGAASLWINEILANNEAGLKDDFGETSYWIELFNPGSEAVNLGGWFLSNDEQNLVQWKFPNVSLPSGGFLVVFASGKDRTNSAPLHTNFKLAQEGEFLALVEPNGKKIHHSFNFPTQRPDVSYGIPATNGGFQFFPEPTPGQPNGNGFLGFLEKPQVNLERGFYNQPLQVILIAPNSGAEIRWTTNGALPLATNGIRYQKSIPITNTTVLRAGAFKAGYLPSETITHSYIFLDSVLKQPVEG